MFLLTILHRFGMSKQKQNKNEHDSHRYNRHYSL
jgi:hypothetical protein